MNQKLTLKKGPKKLKSDIKIKLPSISKTPIQISKNKSSTRSEIKVPQSSKNDFDLELKSKHRILKSMVDVDKREFSVQDSSSLSYSFKRMSAGMKVLGKYQNNNILLKKVYENMNPISEYSYRIMDSDSVAKKKYLVSDHNSWASKHCKIQIRQENSFSEFLDEFFQCIDSNNTDHIPLNDLVLPLLTYGVASDSSYLERALRVIFETENLWTTKITKKIFIEHLKEDKPVIQIIKVLHESAIEIIGNIEEPFPRLYYSIENYMKTIKYWWDILSKSRNIVHNSKVAHFLSSKNLVQGFSKAVKFCSNFNDEEFFDMQCFERFFLKPILIAQLKNVAYGITLEKSELPMSLKLALYQRKLLINGVSEEKSNKSRATLQGAYKFNGKNSSYGKGGILDLKKKVEIEERSNKLRIRQAIYEAEHEGEEFINKEGDIREDIGNIWDVKNYVNSKEASPHGEGSEKLEYNQTEKTEMKDFLPYCRNVKIFRDNFLFEKFQKVASSTYDLLK